MSPSKGTQSQNYVVAMEQPPGNQTGNKPAPFHNRSKNRPTDIQDSKQHVTTTLTGDTTLSPLTTLTSIIEEGLVRDEETNEIYLPLTSTVVLKRKQEMLSVPLEFENHLMVDALVNSGAIVSAIAQNDLDTIKEEAPNNFLKIDDPPNFQIQVANCQLEKPLATTTLKIEIGDNLFAEHFVIVKKFTGPIIGWHFMRNNSVVIGTTHGLIHFPHLTKQAKTASSEATTKPKPVITDDALTIPPTTTKTPFVDHPSQRNTTESVTSLENFTEIASLLISHSMSTINDIRIAVRVTNRTESPYQIKKNTQVAKFSVVTQEQSKHIKPVEMAIFSMIPQGDRDLTAYLNELLTRNKPDRQNNTFCFPIPEIPGKPEYNTPIQTRILRKFFELEDRRTQSTREHRISKKNANDLIGLTHF